jgi:hypothetical protein
MSMVKGFVGKYFRCDRILRPLPNVFSRRWTFVERERAARQEARRRVVAIGAVRLPRPTQMLDPTYECGIGIAAMTDGAV